MLPVECIFTTSEWQILILGKILFPMVYYYEIVSFTAKLWCLNSPQKSWATGQKLSSIMGL